MAMKHAYLIMAHDHPDELRRLIEALDDPAHDIFVHIDIRAGMEPESFKDAAAFSALFFIDRRKVVWGGSSQIETELRLLRGAQRHGDYGYYHLLSGLDYTTQSNEYKKKYFERYNGLNFITIVTPQKRHKMRYDQYHWLHERFVGKQYNLWKYIDFGLCYMQEMVGVHRFGGRFIPRHINWFSLHREFVEYLINHYDQIIKEYRWTYCSDEIFLADYLQRAGLWNTLAPQGSLRFIEWEWKDKHDSSPRILTLSDYNALVQPDILFARKFELPYSGALYAELNRHNGQISRCH